MHDHFKSLNCPFLILLQKKGHEDPTSHIVFLFYLFLEYVHEKHNLT